MAEVRGECCQKQRGERVERRAGVEETAKHASVTETGHRNEVLLNAAHKSQSLYGWTASKGAAIATRSGHRTRAAAAAFQTSSAHKEKKKKRVTSF